MSAHRRSLVTAAAAGTLLCALWFVPTAKAAPDGVRPTAAPARVAGAPGARTGSRAHSAASRLARADGFGGASGPAAGSGGSAAVPYVIGGVGLAGAGGALAVRSLRRPLGAGDDAARATTTVSDLP